VRHLHQKVHRGRPWPRFQFLCRHSGSVEAYILSQKQAGWSALADAYDDGGFSGASLERPAINRLPAAIEPHEVDCVVVYKVDRLSRSLLDFCAIDGCLIAVASASPRSPRTSINDHIPGPPHVTHFAVLCPLCGARDYAKPHLRSDRLACISVIGYPALSRLKR
jgi:hypothetical protein